MKGKREITMVSIDLIRLYPVEDRNFLCAVIAARYKGKWIFVREKGKDTWELPGGTHELNEDISSTASRELREETGAIKFSLTPICITSVNVDGHKSLGKLFYSRVYELGDLPDSEIEEVRLFDTIPDNLTYPLIHSVIFKKAKEFCADLSTVKNEI